MFFMAWSPVRRTNAGRFEVDHPGDYATSIPTTPPTAPRRLIKHPNGNRRLYMAAPKRNGRIGVRQAREVPAMKVRPINHVSSWTHSGQSRTTGSGREGRY